MAWQLEPQNLAALPSDGKFEILEPTLYTRFLIAFKMTESMLSAWLEFGSRGNDPIEREVWRERGRSAPFRGSRIGSNLSFFHMFSTCFLFICFTLVLGVHFCAFWVPHGCKRGSKELPGSSFWTAKYDKTCHRPWM